MIVSIHQPNFLPWFGLIHKIYKSDVFIVFDDVQFPMGKSHFGHRTRIRTGDKDGTQYLTIPTLNRSECLPWHDIKINGDIDWKDKHKNIIYNSYHKSPNFKVIMEMLEEGYSNNYGYILQFNMWFIHKILAMLEYDGDVILSSSLNIQQDSAAEKIRDLVIEANGTVYLSGTGPGSARYVNDELFSGTGIELTYDIFDHPIYPQQFSPFIVNLSIIDMFFNINTDQVIKFLKG